MISITVGNSEKHTIGFLYDTFWGNLKIFVDGIEHTTARINNASYSTFHLLVGETENYRVRIDLNVNIHSGSSVRFFVDEKLVKEEKFTNKSPLYISLMMIFVGFIIFLAFFLILIGVLSRIVYNF